MDICNGLDYLSRCGIIHCDLKPQNILLKSNSEGKIQLLISDFGTAAHRRDPSFLAVGHTGTMEYIAPEIIRQHQISPTQVNYESSSDIWLLNFFFQHLLMYSLLKNKISGVWG